MTYEFQRSNQLMTKLSEKQHDLQIKRSQLEQDIMAKIGQPEETQLWLTLFAVRQEIDALYEEKMQLTYKMFNLGVQFCQQLDLQNQEQKNYIKTQSQNIQSSQQSLLENEKGSNMMSYNKYRGYQLGSLDSGPSFLDNIDNSQKN